MEKLICIKVECEWATNSVCRSTRSSGVWLLSSVPRLDRLSYLFNKKRGTIKNCLSCSFQSPSKFWYLTEPMFICYEICHNSPTHKYNAEYLFVL